MLGKTMLPTDEELGKKDDDHNFKPARRHHHHSNTSWGHAPRWRRKRVLIVLGFCLFTVVLHYMRGGRVATPEGLTSTHHNPFKYTKPTSESGYEEEHTRADVKEPRGPPPGIRAPRRGEAAPHTFDGVYKFYRLAKSLRGAAHTDGYRRLNRNVLFAVSSLKSAATMLPLICEMAKWNRNWVHAAFLGREDIPLEDLLDINGVDRKSCPAIWHDARPDYSEYSTDARAELSVQSALIHIHNFLHPQAAIVDSDMSEDAFLVAAMRNQTERLDMPLIEVPKGKWEDFMWMTRLDAGSLRSWHLPTIDIMVQVPPDSSSVLHLLKSIKEADYTGLALPRITLELPADLDPTVERSLQNFQWPPHASRESQGNQLLLRRRIANHRATQEDAVIRFLELFYPNNGNSHMLLLSPQVQLSPQYLHYIKYLLLEYQYSSFAGDDASNVMGFSLSRPSLLVDGKTPLVPPIISDMHAARYQKMASQGKPAPPSVPFMMQAPNSHATLFFSPQWTELHSFLSARVSKHQNAAAAPTTARPKHVSQTLPSWTEYMLEFMRARGYFLIYPATTSGSTLATVHNELYRAPEEFTAPQTPDTDSPTPPVDSSSLAEPFLTAPSPPPPPKNPEHPLIPHSSPLTSFLPFDADLPEAQHLPHLLFNGVKLDPSSVGQVAGKYAKKFSEEVGGCKSAGREGMRRVGKDGRVVEGVAGLFCWGGETWVEDGEGVRKTDLGDE